MVPLSMERPPSAGSKLRIPSCSTTISSVVSDCLTVVPLSTFPTVCVTPCPLRDMFGDAMSLFDEPLGAAQSRSCRQGCVGPAAILALVHSKAAQLWKSELELRTEGVILRTGASNEMRKRWELERVWSSSGSLSLHGQTR